MLVVTMYNKVKTDEENWEEGENEMDIRCLNPDDAAHYRQFRLEALQNNPEAFAVSYEEELENPLHTYQKRFQSDESFTFGTFEQEKLTGVVTLSINPKKKMNHKASILAMYVAPEKRGLGVGKQLLEAAIHKAKDVQHIEQIYITVVTTNESAKKLYSSLGFEVFAIEKRALKIDGTYFDEEHRILFLT